MEKSLRFVRVLFALCVVFGCLSAVSAQEEQIAGGYGDISKTDAGVVAAAKFAVKKRGKVVKSTYTLVSIEKAEAQVVAGLNYRLCLKVKNRKGEKAVTVVVYKNLKNKLTLTSWTEEECVSSGTD